MSAPTASSARLQAFVSIVIAFIVAFDVAFVWQKFGGAYESEFGAHPDEAAHYVTGLFVRDAMVEAVNYARGGFQGAPVQVAREYAREFYAHYPKVALGVWPPGFHLTQAAWTLPFGTSRLSVLLLMAALAAATATAIFEVVRRGFGLWAASIAALIWLCGPLVREYYGMVMAETLSALTMFGATVLWGRYLDRGRKWDALAFALLASAAIMTKGTGLALGLMCAGSIVLRRSWRTLARPSLWVAALIVVVLAGIWTWTFRHEGLRVGGWEAQAPSWGFVREAAPFYAAELAHSLGLAVVVFAFIGMVFTGRRDGVSAALTSLVLGVLIFQSVVPVGRESRHILAATPALMVMGIAGVFWIARQRSLVVADPALQRRREYLWVILLALLVVPESVKNFERKGFIGFESLAIKVLETVPDGSRILVSSDASGEGMFISEIAMRDRRPNLKVERGSKTLVHPDGRTWGGRDLRVRFPDDDALLGYLLRSKIGYVVLDAAVPEEKKAPYHDQLRRVIRDNTGVFWPIVESPITRDNQDLFPPVQLYRIVREELR